MSLDVVETPRPRPAPPVRAPRHAGPAGPAAGDPPGRGPARHRRRRDPAALADRLWRPPLGLAAAIFAGCGPVHALGHPDLVFHAVLVGLALSAAAVPLGLFGMRSDRTADPVAGESRR